MAACQTMVSANEEADAMQRNACSVTPVSEKKTVPKTAATPELLLQHTLRRI
jgi:hypothetical protein